MSPIERLPHLSMSIRFQFLFIALLLMLAAPVLLPERLAELAVPTLFTVLTLTALATVAERRWVLGIGFVLAVPTIVIHWLSPAGEVWLLGDVLGDVFLIWVTVAIMLYGVRARRITTEVLFAVACVYLLFALIWSMAYGIADAAQPGALSYPEPFLGPGEDVSERGVYTYFSFVTLTTLGYGDVAPVSDAARLLAMFEATLGQLFLVIVVARLVGTHTAQRIAAEQWAKRESPPEDAA